MKSPKEIEDFDRSNGNKLRKLWFVGDPHNRFEHVEAILQEAVETGSAPRWIVFLGDQDFEGQSMRDVVAHLKLIHPDVQVAYIHGNHDADTHEKWALLHNCVDAVALHGRVTELDGIRVAGLGGNFMGRVWAPPKEVMIATRKQGLTKRPSGKQANPKLNGAIYPDEYLRLASQKADILVTHEAPSCHHHGWPVLDDLARSMGVYRVFHGHTHDDLTCMYESKMESQGFDVRAVNCGYVKDGLGRWVASTQKDQR